MNLKLEIHNENSKFNHFYMTQAWCKLAAFSRDEKGESGIEYVLVATIASSCYLLYMSDRMGVLVLK